ncbi:GNAT family N-acetyltransferase [Phytohabitans houttuyneae]|uniref:N-acetyltransferase domain-containing protein n=1 Tax=Phytohabitans houttuyneae TaxID=1076126 RepID=A0A6V8KRV2_9ACTN|nr:GNAT family N-acetyltransferase [Phytohabitans houttuyneae]GFJ83345.1 hypothetical protein Phou_075250 [Phytohabitans houttuyneae]
MRLSPLTAGHRDAVLAFETANRAYFAASVPDRGDGFFAGYPARHAALLAMQAAGTDRFHLLVTDAGEIAGRFNLTSIAGGEAEVGYRVAEAFAGRGAATDGVRQLCELARSAYGLRRLRADTSPDNHASRAVLLRNDFTFLGESTVDGVPTHRFARNLTS